MSTPLPTLVIGGGMITGVQILPSLYQLQREGLVGDIFVSDQFGRNLRKLAEDPTLAEAFPDSSFRPFPDYTAVDPDEGFPEQYKEGLQGLDKRSLVVVALPDQLHYQFILQALEADQNVMTVKPLVLKHEQAVEIERLAREKGLFVGIEYHKRFDDRALMARRHYRSGDFGEFRLAQALMFEPYYYRNSNFQNWCTCENSDMFTYVGCHYVDQIHFITGLLPVEVSVYGIVDRYPNGNEGYLWTDGRVIWENGASLNVIDAMGYPNIAPGGNAQGLRMYMKGERDAGLLFHDDQYRGVKYSFQTKGDQEGDTYYNEPSPDYFKLVYRGGVGLEPVGYGYRSIEALVKAVHRVGSGCDDVDERRKVLREIDGEGVIATPANSSFNELVIEAGRMSIRNDARPVRIEYGDKPRVFFKEY